LLATIGAAVVIWQTIEIARNGVLSWACWTSVYPLVWVGLALLHYLLSVGCMRASLRIRAGHLGTLSATPAGKLARADHSDVLSSFKYWDLTQKGLQVEVGRKTFAKWSKDAADLVNNVNYLYSTAIFTSLTLVSGRIAIGKLGIFGVIAVAARIATVWVLEDIEGED
jgi:hypothetical protein